MLRGVPPGPRSLEPKVRVQESWSARRLRHHSGRELAQAADAQQALPPGHPRTTSLCSGQEPRLDDDFTPASLSQPEDVLLVSA